MRFYSNLNYPDPWMITDEFPKILCLTKTYQRPIWVRRPSYLIGDPYEFKMPDRRPTCLIGERSAWSKTDMPLRRLTCLFGDWNASLETEMPLRRLTCLFGDRHASSKTHWRSGMSVFNGSLLRPVGVFDKACRFPLGSDHACFVSDQTCRSLMGLR